MVSDIPSTAKSTIEESLAIPSSICPRVQGCIAFRVAYEDAFESGRWQDAIFARSGTAANSIDGYYE